MADPAAPVHLQRAPSFSGSLCLSLSSSGQWARGGVPPKVGAGCCPPNLRDSERGERKCCGQEGTGVVAESAKPALSAPGEPELALAGPRHTQPRALWPEPRAVWLADPSLCGADRWRSRTHTAFRGQTRIPPQQPTSWASVSLSLSFPNCQMGRGRKCGDTKDTGLFKFFFLF